MLDRRFLWLCLLQTLNWEANFIDRSTLLCFGIVCAIDSNSVWVFSKSLAKLQNRQIIYIVIFWSGNLQVFRKWFKRLSSPDFPIVLSSEDVVSGWYDCSQSWTFTVFSATYRNIWVNTCNILLGRRNFKLV